VAVRVRMRIRNIENNRVVETNALVNSGFITEKPQLLIPRGLASELGLWPPPPSSRLIELGTAGGPVKNYLIQDIVEVEVVESDRHSGRVVCDVIVSHIEEEVLINDKLGDELGIVLISMGKGLWRFIDDPLDMVRESKNPQYWSV